GPLEVVRVERLVPARPPVDGAGVGIEQQLVRVAAVALVGRPGAVHAITVALPRADAGHVAVPRERGLLGQRDALLTAVVVEETELDLGRDLREDREVGAAAVVGRAEGEGLAGPDAHVVTIDISAATGPATGGDRLPADVEPRAGVDGGGAEAERRHQRDLR